MKFRALTRYAQVMRHAPTDAEQRLWQHLRAGRLSGWKFRRQVPLLDSYIADFVCHDARLVIELDGGQHTEQARYDQHRDQELQALGYRVLRFWNNDVLVSTDAVLEHIAAALISS